MTYARITLDTELVSVILNEEISLMLIYAYQM
jgi:hypothetical protein